MALLSYAVLLASLAISTSSAMTCYPEPVDPFDICKLYGQKFWNWCFSGDAQCVQTSFFENCECADRFYFKECAIIDGEQIVSTGYAEKAYKESKAASYIFNIDDGCGGYSQPVYMVILSVIDDGCGGLCVILYAPSNGSVECFCSQKTYTEDQEKLVDERVAAAFGEIEKHCGPSYSVCHRTDNSCCEDYPDEC